MGIASRFKKERSTSAGLTVEVEGASSSEQGIPTPEASLLGKHFQEELSSEAASSFPGASVAKKYEGTSSRKKFFLRWRKLLGGLLALFLMACGGVVFYQGRHMPPDDVPLLAAPIEAGSKQPAVGPTAVTIAGQYLTASKLPNDTLMLPSLGVVAPVDVKGDLGTFTDDDGLVLPEEHEVTRSKADGDGKDPHKRVLLAGHVSWNGVHGALYDLTKLQAGERAFWKDAQGRVHGYQLESLSLYNKPALPFKELTSPKDGALVVITCGGLKQVEGTWKYTQNAVAVFKKS